MRAWQGKRGMTLLELMVVVAIIGVVAAIAIPSYLKVLPHLRLKGAVMDVSNVLQTARMKAVAKNRTYMVKFNYINNSFEMGEWVTGTTINKEQDSGPLDWIGIDLADSGPSSSISEIKADNNSGTVKFHSNGTASVDNTSSNLQGKGAIFLKNNPINNGEQFRVVIEEVTGKIKIQSLAGTSWTD